jgi:hypothetical protein
MHDRTGRDVGVAEHAQDRTGALFRGVPRREQRKETSCEC